MLVLERKVGEPVTIEIDGQICTVMCTKIGRDRVWIGFEAPRIFRIRRHDAKEDRADREDER